MNNTKKKPTTSAKAAKTSAKYQRTKFVYIIGGILVILVILTGGLFMQSRRWRDDHVAFRGYIRDAIEALYQPTVLEPKEKKQYIYQANIRLPLADDQHPFRYLYQAEDKNTHTKEVIVLTTARTLDAGYSRLRGDDDDITKHVPQYQECSKEFLIQFTSGAELEHFIEISKKSLADGRTAYLYKNTNCDAFYKDAGISPDTQQQIVEHIESY